MSYGRQALAIGWTLALAAGLGCPARDASSAPSPPPEELRTTRIEFGFILQLLEPAPKGALESVRERARGVLPRVTQVQDPKEDAALPRVAIEETPVRHDVDLDPEHLAFASVGVSAEQRASLLHTWHVIGLYFAADASDAEPLYRAAIQLVHELARDLGALVWDTTTHQIYSPEAWKQQRIDTLSDVLDVNDHIWIHASRDESRMEIRSDGMGKFGLPDIVVRGVPDPYTADMRRLVGLFCQSVYESPRLDPESWLSVDVRGLRSESARRAQFADALAGATGRATLRARPMPAAEPDAERVLEIEFGDVPGMSTQVRQAEILRQIYGSDALMPQADHADPELQRAHERAFAAFLELKSRIQGPRGKNERFLVKVPFKTYEATEWMWVEVVRWEGDRITGLLTDAPRLVQGLRAGSEVEVEVSSIFDYIHYLPSGEAVGDETGEIIDRQQRSR